MDRQKHILYGAPTGNCIRAAISLFEAGIAFEVAPLDLGQGQHRTQAFESLNPHKKVPVLVATLPDRPDVVLTQSNAIMMYASENGRRSLLPQQGMERLRTLERLFYYVTDVIAVNHAAFNYRKSNPDAAQHAVQWLVERSRNAALAAEDFLSAGTYIAGEEFTLADIAAFTFIRSIATEFDWSKLPRLTSWYETLDARPGFQSGMKAFTSRPGQT